MGGNSRDRSEVFPDICYGYGNICRLILLLSPWRNRIAVGGGCGEEPEISVGVSSRCPELLKGVNTHATVDALGVWDTPSPIRPSSPTYVRPVLMEVGRRFLETREPTGDRRLQLF